MCQTWLECFFFCRQKKIGPRSIGKGPLTERCVLFPLLPCLHSYYWLNLDLTIFDASELLPPALPVCRRVSPRVRLPPHDQGRIPLVVSLGRLVAVLQAATAGLPSFNLCRSWLHRCQPQFSLRLETDVTAAGFRGSDACCRGATER